MPNLSASFFRNSVCGSVKLIIVRCMVAIRTT